ncbi:hypothetical protein OFO01_07280 [Campylobacter sp. JMF_01 NE2]|uniref:hypothetical protein n=1 Tax=unclassified Campylobacter TaxID=2593542 RepID=UPI0022E9A43C|nr:MULTISPECIES: hypothetical protein [unclassified Campylobacter]MDA3053234.1 hypothetical protein [Campylobacter sp. JMF_03 NE3]MDA3067583.1 hypothetical protein [Campylobacter sp. JMF_01 NE2]
MRVIKLKLVLKKETIKESGKLLLDLAKVIIAVAIVTPLVKNEAIGITPFIVALMISVVGMYLFNKGAKDE